MKLYAIKMSDTEWVSGLRLGKNKTINWEKSPAKAICTSDKKGIEALCYIINLLLPKYSHTVVEVAP